MRKFIDPKAFGLSDGDRIERITDTHWALVVDRKSRIVMADGRRIVEKAEKIRPKAPDVKVSLKTGAPVCSKTRSFLREHGIETMETG